MRTYLALIVVVLLAGCGSRTASPGGGDVEALPVLEPASGGEMVLVSGGRFLMGDAGGRADETPHEVSVSCPPSGNGCRNLVLIE